MSTVFGLILGIVTAAVVTVLYGDALNERVREFGRQLQSFDVRTMDAEAAKAVVESMQSLADTDRPLAVVNEAQVIAPVAAAESVALPVTPAAEAMEKGSVDELQKRWDQYRDSAHARKPAGSFPYRACFTTASAAHGVPEALLLAVARGESNFEAAARSGKDAIGLMQIRWPITGRHLGINREADLYDPCTNVDAGARYLAELSERYGNNLHRVLGAYNYGPGRIDKGPMPEGARWYSQYIYQHLQQVLGEPQLPTSTLLAVTDGYDVLVTFNQSYRAREFMQYLAGQVPEVELAQRSEALGRHEVVMLYGNADERAAGLRSLRNTGLLVLNTNTDTQHSL